MDETYRFDANDICRSRGLAWLSYLGILFLIPLLVNRESSFSKFHANQGLLLFMIELVLSVVLRILSLIPVVRWFALILNILYIPVLILMIVGIINAVQGRAGRLPVIGNIELIH